MKRLRLTEAARRDLDDIWDGIAADDMSAADRMIDGLYTLIGRLREFPSMGAPRDDLRFGTRSFVHKKYLVFYTVSEDALIVLKVVYGGRDLQSIDFSAP